MKTESQILACERAKRCTLIHTVITPLANAYIEVACGDMHLPETQRHWTIRRTVDYSRITLQ
jgi:hypothetical protein